MVAALSSGPLLAVARGRAQPPLDRRAGAERALTRGRHGSSLTWAPAELAAAETRLRAARRAEARESARWLAVRDYGGVERAFWNAELAAWRAERLAIERREAARADAADTLTESEDLVAHAQLLSGATRLRPAQSGAVATARLRLAEARVRYRGEDYRAAAASALAARESVWGALGPALEDARRYTSEEQLETWRRWIEETRAWSRASGRPALIVFKEKNRVALLERGEPRGSFPADIGADAMGRKLQRGDRATPEGRYRIVRKKGRGESRYHKALLLDYPNEADRRRLAEAREAGLISKEAQPGSLIEVHGEGGRGQNWTDGCVAVSNADMDLLFERLEPGSWVTIVGGDGRDGTFSDLVARLGSPRGAQR